MGVSTDGILAYGYDVGQDFGFEFAMLRGFPDVPAGYDGWWTFPKGGSR